MYYARDMPPCYY